MTARPMNAWVRLLLFAGAGAALGAALGWVGQCSSGACPLTATWWRGALFAAALAVVMALGSR